MTTDTPNETCSDCSRTVDRPETAFVFQGRVVCRECNDKLRPRCPCCGAELLRAPKAKTKCPNCGQFIVVRSRQQLFPTTLLTETQAQELDTWRTSGYGATVQRDKAFQECRARLRVETGIEATVEQVISAIATQRNAEERDHKRQRGIRYVVDLGLTASDFLRHEVVLSERFGMPASAADVIWSCFQELALTTRDFGKLSSLFYEMATFLRKEGRDHRAALKQSFQYELMRMKLEGMTTVSILVSGGACAACRKQSGRNMSVVEALRHMPLPCAECTTKVEREAEQFGWCRCLYLATCDIE